jgi:hypothetical protein
MDYFSPAQVAAFRLRNHYLDHRAPLGSLGNVVGNVCGIQAQLMSAAELALWARVDDLTQEDVANALWGERSLVKTWCMRGALHLLVATDLPIYVGGLLNSSLLRERRWIASYGGISESENEAIVKAIVEALANSALTRKELTESVVARIGAKAKRWVEHSWGGIVKQASLQGLVIFGPSRGLEITFVRRDKWLPLIREMPTREAESMLLKRYLHGYGPASLADFAAWSGMTVSDAKPITERIGEEIVEVKVDDKSGLMLRDDLAILKKMDETMKQHQVRLLPSFDPFMLGHKDKNHLVKKEYYKRVYRKAGWLSPTLLVNGKAEGIWSYKKKGKCLRIAVKPFHKISKDVKDLVEGEARSLARFYDLSSELKFIH